MQLTVVAVGPGGGDLPFALEVDGDGDRLYVSRIHRRGGRLGDAPPYHPFLPGGQRDPLQRTCPVTCHFTTLTR